MHLTGEEESIYEGEKGETLKKAMEILVALGDIYGADRLIPIKSAQIAGVSYKTIGDAGLEWISDLHGRVAVKTTLNPAGMDRKRWKDMGIQQDFAEKQKKILEVYERLGIDCQCTCTPYYLQDIKRGDHLAWSESSAISYANSVIGARTNREGGPSALAAALIGKTPDYGYHLDENRKPVIAINVEVDIRGSDFGALGYIAGNLIGSRVPLITLRSAPTDDELKTLGAAMAASGAVALYHVEGVTPEAGMFEMPGEKITIEKRQIDEVYEKSAISPDDADVVALGCPHLSSVELKALAGMLRGNHVKKELWICVSRAVADQDPESVKTIEASGAKVFCDTCMVVSPASERFRSMLVDSGKALKYVPGMCRVKAAIASREDCVKIANGNQCRFQ